jgi:hypothetical protein
VSRSERQLDLTQDALIVLDVLDHIEGANHIQIFPEGNVARIHLHELDAWQPVGREAEGFNE